MSGSNLTLRISTRLREHIQQCTGEHGLYETPSEYLHDLIRRDMEKMENEKWERLRMALAEGLSAKESDYTAQTTATIKEQVRKRKRPGL